MSGDRKKNSRGYIYPEVRDLHIFTVEIDIAKSNVKKVDYINSVRITNDDGITISNSIKDEVFNETFLMDSFSLGTNSQALKDKLYNEISRSFNPYQPKIKKVNNSKSQSEKVVPKTISNKYIQ